jgi:hypothetical protein
LIAIFWKSKDTIWLTIAALIVPIALIAATYMLSTGKISDNSDKHLIESLNPDVRVFYKYPRSYSGQYYSFGQAKVLRTDDQLEGLDQFYLITFKDRMAYDYPDYQEKFDCSDVVAESHNRGAILCKVKPQQ